MTGSASPSSCTGSLGENTSRIGCPRRSNGVDRLAASLPSRPREPRRTPEPLKAKRTPTASDRPPVTGHFLGQALRRDATTLLAQRVRPADDRPHLASFDDEMDVEVAAASLPRVLDKGHPGVFSSADRTYPGPQVRVLAKAAPLVGGPGLGGCPPVPGGTVALPWTAGRRPGRGSALGLARRRVRARGRYSPVDLG